MHLRWHDERFRVSVRGETRMTSAANHRKESKMRTLEDTSTVLPGAPGVPAKLMRGLRNCFGAARQLYRTRRSRAAIAALLTQTDRMLKDIGVSRADVERALSKRWDKDPSQALSEDRRRKRMQADL